MVNLKHSNSGAVKNAPTGFSWTSLFFGLFVPLLRGDVLWCIFSLFLSAITGGIFWLVFPFIYNKIYIKNLLEKGYKPINEQSGNYLKNKGWIA